MASLVRDGQEGKRSGRGALLRRYIEAQAPRDDLPSCLFLRSCVRSFNVRRAIRHHKTSKEIEAHKNAYKSEWRGKLLLELRVYNPNTNKKPKQGFFSVFSKKQKDLPEKTMQRALRMPFEEQMYHCPLTLYELRGVVLCGYVTPHTLNLASYWPHHD